MKASIPNFRIPAVVLFASLLACVTGCRSMSDTISSVPAPVDFASELRETMHRVVTNFTELSERMDPTRSECNQP
jgi:hypothetical protein